jgi:hypothetical protein
VNSIASHTGTDQYSPSEASNCGDHLSYWRTKSGSSVVTDASSPVTRYRCQAAVAAQNEYWCAQSSVCGLRYSSFGLGPAPGPWSQYRR